jgi:hypothetical protein
VNGIDIDPKEERALVRTCIEHSFGSRNV